MTQDISSRVAGYGLAAAIAIVFNTLLAWVKDSVPALNAAMKAAMGHHWITHGVVDVIVFVILGVILSRSAVSHNISGTALAKTIVVAAVMGGGGLAVWFLFV